jgi:ketosteroid isomerase-like protein
MAHPNEALTRKGYEAFAKGNMEALDELIADDIVWHVPGNNPLSGDHLGKAAVFTLFARIVELSSGTLNQEIHDVLANDEHAVVMVVTRAEREGKQLEDRQVHVLHVKDGKVTEFWNHFGNQSAVDEFWS